MMHSNNDTVNADHDFHSPGRLSWSQMALAQ